MMKHVESTGTSVYNVFPLRTSIIPKYIRIDTTTIIKLLVSKENLGTKTSFLYKDHEKYKKEMKDRNNRKKEEKQKREENNNNKEEEKQEKEEEDKRKEQEALKQRDEEQQEEGKKRKNTENNDTKEDSKRHKPQQKQEREEEIKTNKKTTKRKREIEEEEDKKTKEEKQKEKEDEKEKRKQETLKRRKKNAFVWGAFFKTKMSCFFANGYEFDYMIETDGIACSILLVREDMAGTKFKPKISSKPKELYIEEATVEELKGKTVVGIDPGKSDMLFCTSEDNGPRNKKKQKYRYKPR